MKKILVAGLILVGAVIVAFVGLVLFVLITNRTVDQTLATNLQLSSEWTELNADPPLTAFRMSQELAIAIPDYQLDRNERLAFGKIRLPDGQVVSPQVEGIDLSGNTIPFHKGGHTLSTRDLVIYRRDRDLGNTSLAKIRIRSDAGFKCEEILWRNRNPK